MPARQRKRRLSTYFVFLLLVVILVAFGSYTFFIVNQTSRQAENQLLDQARAFTEEMDAVWQFFEVNQDTINYDSEGRYEFKGLYCSIVGKGVGAIFSSDSEYKIRYTNINPRNQFDAPDEFESIALEALTDGSGRSEYYALTTYKGMPVFRYVGAIELKKSCLDCHGEPEGQIDISGYPKEGLAEGDFAGAISIVIPASSYIHDQEETLLLTILFFATLVVLIAVTVFIAIRRMVSRPLEELAVATTDMSNGNLDISLEAIQAKGEIRDLTDRFSSMAAQLKEAYSGLEQKVVLKTEEIRQANEILEQQREKLAFSNEMLIKVNRQLEIDNRYKDDFLAVMSHELRTPLTAILTFIEVLEGEDITPKKKNNALRELKSSTIVLLNMINDTLEMAAIQAGQSRMILDEVDLVDIVNYIEASVAPLAERKNISLSSNVERNVPIIIGDWERLRHALENILSNAIKFTKPSGKVTIEVSYDAENEKVLVLVRDTGIGISSENLNIVFERFTQIENSTIRGYNGSGLGLSVVKEIIEMHNGTVFAKSEIGAGSEFGFALPIEPKTHSEDDEDE